MIRIYLGILNDQVKESVTQGKMSISGQEEIEKAYDPLKA